MAKTNSLFMKITDIKGTSTDSGFKEWISIERVDQGVFSSVGINNNASLLKSGNAGFDHVSFSKEMDSSSGSLLLSVAEGIAIKEIIVVLVAKKAGKDYEMVRWTYSNCIMSQLHVTMNNASDVPVEHLSFAFSQVQLVINTIASDGVSVKYGPNGWDVIENKKL